MKKLLIALIALVGVVCFAADYTPVTEEAAVAGDIDVTGSITASGTGYVAATAQADTNATTTATGYTPQFVGQILIGSQGSGTNAVWVSKGVTTNDWVIVEP